MWYVINKHNNIWICYQYALTINNSEDYSPGGIKMLEVKNIQDENDDRWHDDFLNELDGINIWSVDIGYDSSHPLFNDHINGWEYDFWYNIQTSLHRLNT